MGAGAAAAPQSGPASFNRPVMDQQQRPPPNTYVCYRCGKKGEHWIQFCPTNNDKSFEPIGIKKTTGIPRSFLKTVESDTLQSKKGVMVTQDGNLVVATTNEYVKFLLVVIFTAILWEHGITKPRLFFFHVVMSGKSFTKNPKAP